MNFLRSKLKMFSDNENDDDEDTADEYNSSTESLPVDSATSSRMQVFLRIRPFAENTRDNDVYAVEDSSVLLVKNAGSAEAARRLKFFNENTPKKSYQFSRVFDSDTSQSQFFNQAIKPTVIDFMNNQSSTVIGYGTADSGKTHSLFGSTSNPGVIPRSIEFIYSSIDCSPAPPYKPDRFDGVTSLEKCDRSLELDVIKKLLSCRPVDRVSCEESYKALEDSELNRSLEIFKDSMYSVWISFIEIYNDAVYDLLETDEEGKNTQLKLAIDKQGATYIQGMRSVCATSGLEAYLILNAGQTRLSTVATPTYKSSRSHSIFTMKLLKYDEQSTPAEVEVSSISFCDLAGTGRIQKSVGNDKHLRESRNINKSLLAFGRCLKILTGDRSRQSIGPFRESKLTRLFQHSLSGKENIVLIINMNPTLELIAETHSVLNLSSTAMRLASDFAKEEKKLCCNASNPKIHQEDETAAAATAKVDELSMKNKLLLAEIKEVKSSMLKREYEVRQELADFYSKRFNELEESCKNRELAMEEEKESFMKFSVRRVESYYKEQLEHCANRRRKKIDAATELGKEHSATDLQAQSNFTAKLALLKNSLESTKHENETLRMQKNQQACELSFIKDGLERIADLINTPNVQLDDIADVCELEGDSNLDESVASHFSTIHQLIKSSYELEKSLRERDVVDKSVQCNSDCALVNKLCQEIKELYYENCVLLPQIDDDSLNSPSNSCNLNTSGGDLESVMAEIKEMIVENIKDLTSLKQENFEKLQKIQVLENKISDRENEILETKMRLQESESTTLSLLNEVCDLKSKAKSTKLFNNFDVYQIESENFQVIEEPSDANVSAPNSIYELQSSLSESFSGKVESNVSRSSSDSSRNDSGVGSGAESAKVTSEKHSQTRSIYDGEDTDRSFQDRLSQLKLDYKLMKSQHQRESLRVTELSHELENVQEAMMYLKENTSAKDKALVEYQHKVSCNNVEIERLSNEKRLLEMSCRDLKEKLEVVRQEYEKKLTDSQIKLKVYEESEIKAAKCLEDYWEKSVDLGSKLSVAYSELDKTSNRCYKEHVIKIDKLEKELNSKMCNEHELNEKIVEYEKNIAEVDLLSKKVGNFESICEKVKREKEDMTRLLNDQLLSQSQIEEQLNYLVSKVDVRDSQVTSLKSELDLIIKTNLSNSRKAKELGKEMAKLIEKIAHMKNEISVSEKARRDLEQNSSQEISDLRSRLTIFEENAELLNLICSSTEDKQCEVEALNLKLLDKDRELEFFKKNRSATIQRYECLVAQLHDALKMNQSPLKTKKSHPEKKKYFFNDTRKSSSCEIHSSEPQITNDWKLSADKNSYLLSCPTLQTLLNSTSESSKATSTMEEPTRLVNDVSEKSLQTSQASSSIDTYQTRSSSSSSGRKIFNSEDCVDSTVRIKVCLCGAVSIRRKDV